MLNSIKTSISRDPAVSYCILWYLAVIRLTRITLYSKYKNETQIWNCDKWRGIYVVLLLLLLLLLILNQINLVIHDLFLLFSLSVIPPRLVLAGNHV